MFWKSKETSIEKGALTVALVTIVGSLLGVLKNTLLASKFGASRDLDIYFAAFRIPDFLYGLLVFSSLSSSFMPVFAKAIKNGKEDVWSLISRIFSIFILFFGLSALIVFFFSEKLALLIAPGFSLSDIEKLSSLLRILMIQPIFLSLSNLFSITLQGFKKFFVSSLAPVFYNVGIIIGVAWFSDFWGISGVAWGVVFGALLHLLIQIPGLKALGFKFLFNKTAVPYLKETIFLMIPRSMTILMNNVVLFWVTSVSSLLAVGSLGIYNLADSLQSLPITVVVMSLVTASFPFISQKWADYETEGSPERKQDFINSIDEVFSRIAIIIVPITLAFAAFSKEIVGLFLGYGNFSFADQMLTGLVFLVFVLFLPFQAFTMFLIRAFFAATDTKTPFLIRIVSAVVFQIPLIWLASKTFGIVGLVFGLNLGYLIDSLLLYFLFKKRIGFLTLPLSKKNLFLGLRFGGLCVLPVLIFNLLDYQFFNFGLFGLLFLKGFLVVVAFVFGVRFGYLKLPELKSVFKDGI
ncbi:MAG: murein biosynthesis integral membrane protein MurJ [Candidatus Brennerbacteria bacterium RIFOXYC1_FULL_41_11]|nr:MAG: murein biosynthesis integral membrane protein MurJ [Candidatus Brennerbacteria bacterium RIFOXYC1_FULL_41_11]